MDVLERLTAIHVVMHWKFGMPSLASIHLGNVYFDIRPSQESERAQLMARRFASFNWPQVL